MPYDHHNYNRYVGISGANKFRDANFSPNVELKTLLKMGNKQNNKINSHSHKLRTQLLQCKRLKKYRQLHWIFPWAIPMATYLFDIELSMLGLVGETATKFQSCTVQTHCPRFIFIRIMQLDIHICIQI